MPDTDPPKRRHVVTEAEWRACADPLWLLKPYRGPAARKVCLLGCAVALDGSCGFRTEGSRGVVAAIRTAALAVDAANLRMATTLAATGSGGVSSEAWRLGLFVSGFAYRLPCTKELRTLIGMSRVAVREEARAAVIQLAAGALQQYGGRPTNRDDEALHALYRNPDLDRYGLRATDQYKEALLALIPEPARTAARRGPWEHALLPDRVRTRIYSAICGPRLDEANARTVALTREVLGNPFRTVTIPPEWREANFGAAVRIAEHVEASGDYSQVPILADALEDAGCRDAEVLAHCRTGEHVPGCWVVDAVLGRG